MTINDHPKALLRFVKLAAILTPLLLAGCSENWIAKIEPPSFLNDLSATAPRQPAA